jgi:hypothetical protein
MIQGVQWQREHIFYILGIEKSDKVDVAQVMFCVGEWT